MMEKAWGVVKGQIPTLVTVLVGMWAYNKYISPVVNQVKIAAPASTT